VGVLVKLGGLGLGNLKSVEFLLLIVHLMP